MFLTDSLRDTSPGCPMGASRDRVLSLWIFFDCEHLSNPRICMFLSLSSFPFCALVLTWLTYAG